MYAELEAMAKEISRRALGRAALVGGAAMIAGKASAQDPVSELEKQLAIPFDAASKPLVAAAVKAISDNAQARHAHPLPDGSEPCTRYVPSGKETR